MKRFIPILVICTVLLHGQEMIRHFGLDKRNAYEYSAEYTFDTDTEKQNHVLILEDIRGEISIIGSIDPQVYIEETITVFSHNKREGQKAVEKAKARVKYQDQMISITGNRNDVDADLEYYYEIRHPKNVSVQVYGLGGDIELENIVGEVKIESRGGDISFDRVMGKVNGRTAGGDITVRDSEGVFTIVTLGGDLDIRGSNGKVFGSTRGGDMTVESYNGVVELESMGGSITLRRITGTTVTGTTKGGDIEAESIRAHLELKTYGGNIEITDLNGNARVETNAGDIEMLQILGEVIIATNAGDIDLLGMYGSVKATSYMGDIQLQKLKHEKTKNVLEKDRIEKETARLQHNLDLYAKYGDISVKLPEELTIELNAIVENASDEQPIRTTFPVRIIENMDETVGQAIRGIDSVRYLIKLKSNHGTITIEDL